MAEKLAHRFVEKVWGVDRLPISFADAPAVRIGEICFDPPPARDHLLVKFLFTRERLSIQAHPSDAQARELALGPCGKDECWIIVDAVPGATIAAGFVRHVTTEEVRKAALDGSIIDLLVWHQVSKGDVFFAPAGTVHAIGAGVSLIEVQQNCDLTFRLFDYGRPRELHLDQGLAVADTGPYPSAYRKRVEEDGALLVDNASFKLVALRSENLVTCPEGNDGPFLAIPYSGSFRLKGEEFSLGDCAFVDDLSAVASVDPGILLLASA